MKKNCALHSRGVINANALSHEKVGDLKGSVSPAMVPHCFPNSDWGLGTVRVVVKLFQHTACSFNMPRKMVLEMAQLV
jgi:hypothetical protein